MKFQIVFLYYMQIVCEDTKYTGHMKVKWERSSMHKMGSPCPITWHVMLYAGFASASIGLF